MCPSVSCKSCKLLLYAKKEKYLNEIYIYVYFHKKKFPQAYLFWVPKLDVPKISILLSIQNGPKISSELAS